MSNGIQKIRNRLKGLADKEKASHLQRYFKTGKGEYGEGDIFLGIRVPDIRKLVKEFRDLSIGEVSELLKSKLHEERLFSLLTMVDKYSRGDERVKKEIYSLYLKNTKFINNWDLVDLSAGDIVGGYLMERDKTTIYKLAESKDLWERRISILSTFYFIKHNSFDHTLNIAKILLHDSEDLIHKAVGWMLREVGKRNMEIEEGFLQKHYMSMPRTMLRYSIERFPEEKRLKYLKGKI
ncbi:DNA alkylation repair protein [Thermodesulfobacteriota bacterium]